jgi:hypothetical protein
LVLTVVRATSCHDTGTETRAWHSPRTLGTFQFRRRWCRSSIPTEATMGIGKGALLWLIGIPIPIIILLMLFWR